jgi:hypothetical protein
VPNTESESAISDQSQEDMGPFSPVISKRGFGIGSIVRKAASVASVAAKHAYAAAAASTTSSDEEMVPLKCCLISISLPWEHIAYDLLFKVKSLFPNCYGNLHCYFQVLFICLVGALFTYDFVYLPADLGSMALVSQVSKLAWVVKVC